MFDSRFPRSARGASVRSWRGGRSREVLPDPSGLAAPSARLACQIVPACPFVRAGYADHFWKSFRPRLVYRFVRAFLRDQILLVDLILVVDLVWLVDLISLADPI